MRLLLAIVALTGCEIGAGSADEHPSFTQTLPDGPCAVEDVTGDVPGVTISIRSDACVYARGTAAAFHYEVTASATTPAITIPDSGGGCGDCEGHTTDPASFVRWSIGGTSAGGESQDYCICDVGCCAPTQTATIQLDALESAATIDWQGREWSGPSDTGNPMGELFLPGRYDVVVTFEGYAAGSVQARLPIEIVDP